MSPRCRLRSRVSSRSHPPRSRRAAAAWVAGSLGALLLAASAVAAGPPPETPAKQSAARFLKPEEMSGVEWRVAPEAANDGMFNLYTVESRFGSFQAHGRSLLGVRVKELEALVELEKVSKTKVFTDAVASSAMAPVKVVVAFADSPTETVKGISSGVGRLWSKTKFQVKEVSHDAEETISKDDDKSGEEGEAEESKAEKGKEAASSYAKKYLGLSGAERRWYGKLGVDPYTDNAPLRKAVKEVSRVEAAANFSMRFAGLPSIPGAREIAKVMDLVWTTDPWELRQRNRKLLLEAGLPEESARAFEDNEALSPTLQTALLQSVTDLQGVGGRVHLIESAIDAESVGDARLLVTSATLLVRVHRQVTPLAEILPGARLPVARAKDGRLVAVIPAEALFWTEEIAKAAAGFAERYAGEKATARELRVVGEASGAFEAGAGSLGWKVFDKWQSAAPEDRQVQVAKPQ